MRNNSVAKRKYILLGSIVCGILVFLFIRSRSRSQEIITPLAETVILQTQKSTPTQIRYADPAVLVSELKSFTEKKTGAYSVYVYDIKADQGFGFNETTILTAASVNKLPILATLYADSEKGRIDLDRRVTIQAKDIQDYGTGIIRYEGPGGLYSLKTLAQLLIEKSDNTAAYVLTTILGETHIQESIEAWGLTQTDIKNNKTSNQDMAKLMVKMYKGEIVGRALTQEMIGLMDDSDFENRLPKLLPKDINVYHKIGNEIGNIHDIGIVDLAVRPFYIGVMTNDVIDEPTTEEAIAQISKMVYDFMSSR